MEYLQPSANVEDSFEIAQCWFVFVYWPVFPRALGYFFFCWNILRSLKNYFIILILFAYLSPELVQIIAQAGRVDRNQGFWLGGGRPVNKW